MSDKVTMQDVARAADVSVAVVSRVLNNLPAVRPETRQRVQATMKRLCYRPDTRGRGVSQGSRAPRSPQHRHRRIMLLGFNANLKYGSPVYLDMLAGIEAELRDSAYAMELRCIPSGDSWDAAEIAASVDGVVLLLSIHESPFDLLKLTRLVPCVQAMGPFTDSNPWDHVTYDNDAIGRLAARYLLERGHRRCAVATFPEDSPLFCTRIKAFCTTVAAAGGQVTVLRDRTMANPGYCMDGIGPGGITGIYSVADLLTPMLYENLRRAGHQPQQDVEIVSTNFERPLLSALQPPPAVVDIHAAEVGHRAVRQLLWRLDHPRHLHERVLVNVSLASPAEVQSHLWSSQPASQAPTFA